MKPIPNKLECAYCVRNRSHGGECGRKDFPDDKGCLAFKADERGCIRNTNTTVEVPINGQLPLIGEWDDSWALNGLDTEIRILRICQLNWDAKQGKLIIVCNCDYYINDFADDYIEDKKPIFKIIK